MECLKDRNLYEECKKIVKIWECNFTKKKGRPPSKFDIREADKHVRHAYGMYFKLKTAALEQSLSDIFRDDDDNDDYNEACNTSDIDINNEEQQGQQQQQQQQVVEEEIPEQKQNKNDTKPEVNDEVWGEHLNKKVKDEIETTNIPQKPEKINSALTQKLFKNSKFIKRNPRKSFQLNKSTSSLNSSQSFSQPISSSQYDEIENTDISADISLSSFNSTLPIASDTRQISSQSVNVITELLEARHSSVRHVDKGWLQRVSINTGTKLLDSSNAPSNNEIFGDQIEQEQIQNEFDSDDVISDSDEEIYNSLHLSKRLKLSSTINNSSINISSTQADIKSNNTNISNTSISRINHSEISSSKSFEFENIEAESSNKTEPVNATNLPAVVKESENELKTIEKDVESDDEEIVRKKPRRNIKVISDEDSDYEESTKPILKRKRNLKKATKSAPKEKTKTTRTTKNKKEKEKDSEEIVEKIEEYEMEYSIKPPPPTVPRINIKNVLVESKLEVTENSMSSAPIQTQEKIKKQIAKDKLLKKIQSGSLNDNFVRLDIKKKVYVRGKKHMNFTKFKKQMYKNKKKALYGPDMDMGGCDGGELTCFKCGKTGHFARQCKAHAQADKLLPLNAVEEDESTLPSMEEASKMARDSALAVHAPNQLFSELETTIKSIENSEMQINAPPEENNELEKETSEEENKDSEYEFDDDDDLESFMKNTDIGEEIKDSTSKVISEMSRKWVELLEENYVKPLYELNEDGTLPETPKEVFEALKKFGHTEFRAGQEQAVMRILCGQSTLVTLSTGSGKSLCYQLPAYMYAKRKNCVTLVISPLVSLMEDQVAGIPAFFNAACLHTNQTATQKEKVLKLIDSGDLNILLVSPEAVTSGEKKSGFGSVLRKLPPIAFACIDEAHCVSQWSHNFRPSYLVICRVLRERLGIQMILGLTATSTHATSTSIVEHLKGRDQNELRRHIYANSMDRHVIRKLLKKIFVPCDCKNICPRHEVAFSIERTVKELDVPEENISTLLCYLELHERRYLEVLTPVYTHCKIISYGSPQNIIKAAKDCPPLAMALALQKVDSLKDNVFEFPVVDVSSAMGWDSGMVKSKLKNLEWVTENNMPKRSTLTVEFSNLGFHLRAPGNLPPTELDDALDSLFAKKKEQETTSLQQLQVVYNTLTAVTEKYYHLCLTEEYTLKSEKLKRQIREYFSCEQPLNDIELTNKCVANEQQIIADVRCLVAMYRDNNFTGRAAARILHGIQSPNYPAVIWGRCKFWRAHLNTDFNQVCQICTTEILKLR